MNLSAAVQDQLERAVFHMLQYWASQGFANLCLAGGVAHNSTLNGKILQSGSSAMSSSTPPVTTVAPRSARPCSQRRTRRNTADEAYEALIESDPCSGVRRSKCKTRRKPSSVDGTTSSPGNAALTARPWPPP